MVRIHKVLGLIFTLAVIYSCEKGQDQNPSTDFITYNDNKGIIGAGGGRINVDDQSSPLKGVSIDIPPEALLNPININISQISKGYSIENDSSGLFVSIEPSGTTFLRPIQLCIPYSDDEDPDGLQVYFYDEAN